MKMMTFTPAQVEPIVDLWNRRVCGCYATGPMTPEVFLADVAGKAYFDPDGLILAVDGGRPVAFAHAGFKSTDWVKPDLRTGTVSMLAVEEGQLDAGAQALAAAVRYLLRRGAKQVQAFTIDFPNTPFYSGLYGGELAGMDEEHPSGQELLSRCHFRIGNGAAIMLCDLADDIPPMADPSPYQLRVTPWETPLADRDSAACYGIPEPLRRASLLDEQGVEKAGISFWHLDRYNRATGDLLAVVTYVGAAPDVRGTGLAERLQREVHRILKSEGAQRVGLGTGGSNGVAVGFYRKLGYRVLKNAFTFYLDWRRYEEFR